MNSPSTPMAATTTHPMTVEEFRDLPEDAGPVYHELRHGELVPVTRPKFKHFRIQKRLEQLRHSSIATTGKYLHARPKESSSRFLAI